MIDSVMAACEGRGARGKGQGIFEKPPPPVSYPLPLVVRRREQPCIS